MRLPNDLIKRLQTLLRELYGNELTDEEAQEAGLNIMRFAAAKAQREQQLSNRKENDQP